MEPSYTCSDALERRYRSAVPERVPILAGTERNEFHLKICGTERNKTTFFVQERRSKTLELGTFHTGLCLKLKLYFMMVFVTKVILG